MTLTKKTVSLVALTIFVFSLLNLLVVQYFFVTTFENYEDEDVARNSARVLQSIDRTYSLLNSRDWSVWTETYDFLHGDNNDFLKESLEEDTLTNIGIDLMILANARGEIMWSDFVPVDVDIEPVFDESLMPPHLLEGAVTGTDLSGFGYTGILSTFAGPMLIAAQPVLRSDSSGPPSGTLVMGRLLDRIWRDEVVTSTKVDFHLSDLAGPTVPYYVERLLTEIDAKGAAAMVIKSNDLVRDYRVLNNLDGERALLVETGTRRDIWNQGQNVRLTVMGSALVAGLAILLVISFVLRTIVSGPLRRLTEHIRLIKKTGEIPHIAETESGDEIGLLARQFESLMKSRMAAEEKTRLLSSLIERADKSIAFTDSEQRIQYANSSFDAHIARLSCQREGLDLKALFAAQGHAEVDYDEMLVAVGAGQNWSGEVVINNDDGSSIEELVLVSPIFQPDGTLTNISIFYQDITEKNSMERQLNQAQRLESVGQLAAGVAHEVNTPIQFVGDNTKFIKDAFADIDEMLGKLTELAGDAQESVSGDAIRAALNKMDADYLREEVPVAIDQSLEGISRVSNIVRAMKEFAHPSTEQSRININKAIESTVTVASNEWKYVAEMQLDLAEDMPFVVCNVGQLNQVILNMIVNAAHALTDSKEDAANDRGTIAIATSHTDEWAEIQISDNGIGMPEDIKARIFDPFFTTKEVGKGTGQGLSIAYDVVVNRHKGTIEVASEPGSGTTFTIRIPLEAENDELQPMADAG